MILVSFCEEHIDDLSQFATSSSRIQHLQDAARIGIKVGDGTAKLGLTVSCKSTLLAHDKSLGKFILGHLAAEGVPICQGTAATDPGIETAAGKRKCASHQWKRIWKGRRRANRVDRLCRTNPAAYKLAMTGIHLVHVYGHTAQEASTAQVNGMSRNLKMGTVLGKTRYCAVSTVDLFFRIWRGFDFDTRRRSRKI